LPNLNTGGVERGVVDFNRHLVLKGHSSFVISGGGWQEYKVEADGGTHISLNIGRKNPLTFLRAFSLARKIEEIQPDIIHIRSRAPAWVLLLALKITRYSKPLTVSTFHGLYSVGFYSSVMARFDQAIAVSKTVESYILQNYRNLLKNKPELIYRGSDSDYFYSNFEASNQYIEEFNNRFPRSSDSRLITMPGRLSRRKGQIEFIDLIKRLPPEYIGLILGPLDSASKTYLRDLKQKIKHESLQSRVYFYNAIHDLREIISLSDLVVNLSQKPETFGRTILEAAMMGKKICGWDSGGVGEVLGLFFPQGKVEKNNIDALAQTVQHLCNRPKSPSNIHLTSNLMHENTISLYKKLLSQRSNNSNLFQDKTL